MLPTLDVERYIISTYGIGAAELHSLDSVRRSMYLVMEAADGGNLKNMVIRQMTGRWVWLDWAT